MANTYEKYRVEGVRVRKDLYYTLKRQLHQKLWSFREWLELKMCEELDVEYVDGVNGLGKDDLR
jgi:hypothetical protein